MNVETIAERSESRIGEKWTVEDHVWMLEKVKLIEELAADMRILAYLEHMRSKDK